MGEHRLDNGSDDKIWLGKSTTTTTTTTNAEHFTFVLGVTPVKFCKTLLDKRTTGVLMATEGG